MAGKRQAVKRAINRYFDTCDERIAKQKIAELREELDWYERMLIAARARKAADR